MKRLIISILTGIALVSTVAAVAAPSLAQRLSGKILLAVEDKGKTYYVHSDGKRYRITASTAFEIFKRLSLGISNKDLATIPEGSVGIEPEMGASSVTGTPPSPAPTPQTPANPPTAATPSEITIVKHLGEDVEFATIRVRANRADERQTISSSNPYSKPANARPNTKFIVVDLTVTNITKNPFMFDTLPLKDNKGRSYDTYEHTIGSIDNYLHVRTLSPDIPESGMVVFEVPSDAVSYSLVAGKTGTNEVYEIRLK